MVKRHLSLFEINRVRASLKELGLDSAPAIWQRISREYDHVDHYTVFVLDQDTPTEQRLIATKLAVRNVPRRGMLKTMYCVLYKEYLPVRKASAVDLVTRPPVKVGVLSEQLNSTVSELQQELSLRGYTLGVAVVDESVLWLTLCQHTAGQHQASAKHLVDYIRDRLAIANREIRVQVLPGHYRAAQKGVSLMRVGRNAPPLPSVSAAPGSSSPPSSNTRGR